jgi:hypothetical protein
MPSTERAATEAMVSAPIRTARAAGLSRLPPHSAQVWAS